MEVALPASRCLKAEDFHRCLCSGKPVEEDMVVSEKSAKGLILDSRSTISPIKSVGFILSEVRWLRFEVRRVDVGDG